MRVLVVCLGNICRSPMGEGALRARLDASWLAGRVEVDSAGTGDWHVGEPPDPRAIATARRHGVDIAAQRARQLVATDGEAFDWLLCADAANLRDVRARLPASVHARTARLLEWAGLGDGDVPDPYTGGTREFEQAWKLLDEAAVGIVARLEREHASVPRLR